MSKAIPYRCEIDGLRAIAILAVLFYHAQYSIKGHHLIPGGFLGVDVFFVISGYLISSIVLHELKEKRFGFATFYERRIRRILPMLLVMMIVCLPLAWVYLIPYQMVHFCRDTITALFFTSNIRFWLQDPYWAEISNLKPLLHTWSLSVEEQFYLIMPLLLIGLCRFCKKHLGHGLITLAVLSLLWTQWLSNASPEQAFFLLPSRMWELLLGAWLATLSPNGEKPRMQHAPTLGLFMIISSFFIFDEHMQHPSFLTLIPTLGGAFILRFANAKDWATCLLQTRLFVGLGLISYSLYLWHFPVFAFYRIAFDAHSNQSASVLLLATLALSIASYFLIEQPFRNCQWIAKKPFAWTMVLLSTLVLLFAFLGTKGGFANRVPTILRQPITSASPKNHHWFKTQQPRKGAILLIGDSHAEVIASTLKNQALAKGYDFALSAYHGCQLLMGTEVVNQTTGKATQCTPSLQQARMHFIEQSPKSLVVLMGRLPLILEETRFDNKQAAIKLVQNPSHSLHTQSSRQAFIQQQYKTTVEAILASGHDILLVYPVPEVDLHVTKKIFRMGIGHDDTYTYHHLMQHPITTSHRTFQDRVKNAYALLDSIQDPHIMRLYPEKLFCNDAHCITHDASHVFYADSHHLSKYGAKRITKPLWTILKTS